MTIYLGTSVMGIEKKNSLMGNDFDWLLLKINENIVHPVGLDYYIQFHKVIKKKSQHYLLLLQR